MVVVPVTLKLASVDVPARLIFPMVAVPPFASTNLSYQHEHLKGAYAKLVEQAVLANSGVVVVELAVISWIRWKYMDTPPIYATLQVAFGGALVFATGILIGSS